MEFNTINWLKNDTEDNNFFGNIFSESAPDQESLFPENMFPDQMF
jgi:hypothetical protein